MTRTAVGMPGDRGGSILNYAVVLGVVATLALAVIAAGTPATTGSAISEHVRWTVCSALRIEDCEPPGGEDPARDPEYYAADLCEVRSETESRNAQAQVLISYDGTTAFTRHEWANGDVWYIAYPLQHGVGAGVGVGGRIQADEAGGTRNASASIDGSYDWGDGKVWVFEADQQDEAEEFDRRLREDTSVGSNIFSRMWQGLTGGSDDLPEPDMELEMHGGSLGASAAISSGIRITDPPGREDEMEIDLGVGASASLGGSVQRIIRTDHTGDEPIISQAHQISGAVGADGEVILGVGGGHEWGWTASVRHDRNEDGELQSIFLSGVFDRHGHIGGRLPFGLSRGDWGDRGPDLSVESDLYRDVTSTRLFIEFDNDEQREIGERFLEQYGGFSGAAQYFWDTMRADHGFVGEDPGPDGDPWEKLVYDQAQVWQYTSDQEYLELTTGGHVYFKIIPIGGSHTTTSSEQETVDAWYLGPPEDGARVPVRHDACIAGD